MSKLNLNEVIFETKITVEDLIACMDEQVREKFNSLPTAKQQELIDKHSRLIGKGIESGLMDDWTYISRVAMDSAGLTNEIEDY